MNSVGKKLLWVIGAPAMLAAVSGVAYFWNKTQDAIHQAEWEEARAISDWVESALGTTTSSGPKEHASVAEALQKDLKIFRSVQQLRILNSKGMVVFSRSTHEAGHFYPDAQRVLRTVTTSQLRREHDGVEFITPLQGARCQGCHTEGNLGVIHLKMNDSEIQQDLRRLFFNIFIGVMIFGAILAFALSLGVNTLLSRPLRKLTELMKKAESGDFLVRSEVRRNDEWGTLAQVFNRMLAAITTLKAEELETHRDLEQAQAQLGLKAALERSNSELKSRLTELSTLYDVAGYLTSTLSLQELLDRITHLVPERLNIPQFSIMLLNTDGNLEIRSAFPSMKGEIVFDFGEGVCGQAARNLKFCYVGDAEHDLTHYRVHPGTPRSRGSLLSVPMIHGGELLGVLNFERPEKHAFSMGDIQFLTAVADQAALAVKNARLHEQTVELSLTDALTQVSNRRHLFSRLENEIARARRFETSLAILMIDIDHFKKLNDSAGHRAGDDALRMVSSILRNKLRKVDTLARYGGEEFVVLLPQVSKVEAIDVAEKLRKAIENTPFEHAHVQPSGIVSISVGVGHFPSDASLQETLIDCADAALYAAKRGGRNNVKGFAPGMEEHPGRERGPAAAKRARTTEIPIINDGGN